MAASFTPLQPMFGDLRLVYGCSATENKFHEAPDEQFFG
jgi:hypothetical protein